MTVVNSPRRSRTAGTSLATVPEDGEGPDSSRSRSPVSLPTEYSQSYRSRNAPRPRNPLSGWQTRNVSSILPVAPDPPLERRRPLRRRPEHLPWLRREESQIFPQAPVPVPAANEQNRGSDENNNPDLGLPRRRPQWPWQARAQASHIFFTDAITSPSTAQPSPRRASRSQSGCSRWPWQERANKSVIFDVLTSKELEKPLRHRKYDWDQRQSTSIRECVQQQKTADEPTPASSSSSSASSISKKWPWQERAMKSVIFTSPDKQAGNKQMKYMWDQRKTRFSVKLDPEARFTQGSHYSDNYVKWQKTPVDHLKAAGRPCYKEDDVDLDTQKRARSGKRQVQSKTLERKRSSSVIIAHPTLPYPAPPTTSTSTPPEKVQSIPRGTKSTSSLKGSTCMELVPVDFDFKNEKTKSKKTEKIKENRRAGQVLIKSPEAKKKREINRSGSQEKDINGNINIVT